MTEKKDKEMTMKKKIFSGVFCTSMLVLLLSIAIVMGVLWSYYSREYDDKLRDEAQYISGGIQTSGISYLNDIGSDALQDSRITWIANDGTVIYDSSADPKTMENHADREEVAAALKKGHGECTRYSSTLAEKTHYYAIKLQ